jgi:hypothetical protein
MELRCFLPDTEGIVMLDQLVTIDYTAREAAYVGQKGTVHASSFVFVGYARSMI